MSKYNWVSLCEEAIANPDEEYPVIRYQLVPMGSVYKSKLLAEYPNQYADCTHCVVLDEVTAHFNCERQRSIAVFPVSADGESDWDTPYSEVCEATDETWASELAEITQ